MSDKLYDDVHKGAKAQALLNDEVLQEAFTSLAEAYVKSWKREKDPLARELIWFSIQGLEQVHDHLIAVVSNGKLADRQIEDMILEEKRRKHA